MGEYATYNGERIKIGTCEDMYYLRFDQRHMVAHKPGNVDPVHDAAELRFRFPFPDEDSNSPGNFDDYHRGVIVRGYEASTEVEHDSVHVQHASGYSISMPCPESGLIRIKDAYEPGLRTDITVHRNHEFKGAVELVAQKWRPGIGLVPILRCAACHAMWRIEDRDKIELLAVALRSEGDRYGAGTTTFSFYHTIADRVLGGLLDRKEGTDANVHAAPR